METDTDLSLGQESLLDNDTVPNANQSLYCFSCETPMQGLYCGACGQKNDNYRRSLSSLGIELFTSLTAIEGRIWRTWGALLFKPGKVARQFADGRRTHWSSPIRVFLAMSLILFSYIAITKTQIISADINIRPKKGIETPLSQLTPSDLVMSGGLHMFETQKQIDTRNENRNFDLIDILLEQNFDEYDLDLTPEGISFTKPGETADGIRGSVKTITDLSEAADELEKIIEKEGQTNENASILADIIEELNKSEKSDDDNDATTAETEIPNLRINNKDVSAEQGRESLKKFIRNPSRFNNEISKFLPRVMFLMMPLTMLIGAMFIRGRGNALLYDHLVHTAYIHSVLFFLLLVGLILGRIAWLPGGLITVSIIGYLIIYLPLSLRTMFHRGWFKTIWASYGVASLYSFFMFFILIFLVSRGFIAQFGS